MLPAEVKIENRGLVFVNVRFDFLLTADAACSSKFCANLFPARVHTCELLFESIHFKMGHPWPLFRYFSSFQTNITIQQQLYLSSIRGRDMNPQSSDCESHTITTRPRLASYQNIKFCCKYFAFPNLRTRQAIVTRFGKIPPLWPIFKSLGQFFRVS